MSCLARIFGLIVFMSCLIDPAKAATFQLGGSFNAACGYSSSEVTGGAELHMQCLTSSLVYDSDTGDIYSCSAEFRYHFINGVFQTSPPTPATLTCGKTVSLPVPQTVDSRSNQLLPVPVILPSGYTIVDMTNQTYWYLDKNGAIGVCIFSNANLPQPRSTLFGQQDCVAGKL